MSALAWMFGLGMLAIGFPVLFHLIRRTPKGQTEFSSLMFLKPSPPKLTRRSRLENWLLLLLRAAAIGLIAFAFMRPFIRPSNGLAEFEIASRRVAILVDTSASMRRSNLWEQVQKQVGLELDALEAGDDVGLFAFDWELRTIVPFRNAGTDELASQIDEIEKRVAEIAPTWARSDLGRALVESSEALELWRDTQKSTDAQSTARLQIVVVSDVQKGSQVDALQSYQWPPNVYVKFRNVVASNSTNATVALMNPIEEDDDPALRVRVANAAESQNSQFDVTWSSANNTSEGAGNRLSFHVPPGTSRVLKVDPAEALGADQFVLSADDEPFDNVFFTVPVTQQAVQVVFFGDDDPNDPENDLFYLTRALVDVPSRSFSIQQIAAEATIDEINATLVILKSIESESQKEAIDGFLRNGGTIVVLLTDKASVAATTQWTGVEAIDPIERGKNDYSMLVDLSFSHPLFEPFASAGYNDFTQIRFWKFQTVEIVENNVRVLASFEGRHPAIWQRKSSAGTVFSIATGWSPSHSQLALSTKFVPLINRFVDIAANVPELAQSLKIGDPLEFPSAEKAGLARKIIKPDGSEEAIDDDQTRFSETDCPGIYRLLSGQSTGPASGPDSIAFAVNVDSAESESTPISLEQFESLEVNIGEQPTASNELAQMRELRDRELENQQKLWKWLIVSAILLLFGETWLASRTEKVLTATQTA